MTALTALLGAGTGVGLVLIISGLRGTQLPTPPRRLSAAVLQRRGLRLAGALAAGVAVGAATGWPVAAALATAATLALPALLAGGPARAREIGRVEAVASWAEMLRDTMAGAAGLEQAIIATAPIAPLPIRAEVAALAVRLERERLTAALRAFADDIADPSCDLVVAALLLAAQHQAHRLGELLGTLAVAARDQTSMRLRVEAGRARTRTSVKVIIGVTLSLAVVLAVLNRDYLSPYDSPVGQLVLLVVGGLFAGGFAWLARMTRPAPPQRFLAVARDTAGGQR